LPRKIFAGADIMLVPSVFEPGGIVALEALRYGSVPLVRRTGGLADSITDFDPNTRHGNGFSFVNKNAWSLYGSLVEALTIHAQPKLWERLVNNCLADDFSWEHAAGEYEEWYRSALRDRARGSRRYYEKTA
jgi:starch synthase